MTFTLLTYLTGSIPEDNNRLLYKFVVYAYSMPTASHFKVKGVNEVKKGRDQWGMQGRAQGQAQAPPTLFLDQTKAKRDEIFFLETGPPPLISQGLNGGPHPLPTPLI